MERGEYDVMFRVEDTHWWYHALHRLIRRSLDWELPDWRKASILDAGCGTGAILELLGNPHKHVGIDLSPDAVAFCRRRGLQNVVQSDVSALPFADASFDAVICSSVLYHQWVKDVGKALQELRRVLRPGGLLLVNLPAYQFLHSAHDDAVFTARRFTRSEVQNLLSGTGLGIRYLTYWTTLLFPIAIVARTLGGSSTGRDFDAEEPSSLKNRALWMVMTLELWLMRWISLPFGVALFAVAEKPRTHGKLSAACADKPQPMVTAAIAPRTV
jgi:SAM-dependent methyltransferase